MSKLCEPCPATAQVVLVENVLGLAQQHSGVMKKFVDLLGMAGYVSWAAFNYYRLGWLRVRVNDGWLRKCVSSSSGRTSMA